MWGGLADSHPAGLSLSPRFTHHVDFLVLGAEAKTEGKVARGGTAGWQEGMKLLGKTMATICRIISIVLIGDITSHTLRSVH